jgi:hypothetical protein
MLLKAKKQKESPPQFYTTAVNPPAQQNVSIIDQINQSIDKFLRG